VSYPECDDVQISKALSRLDELERNFGKLRADAAKAEDMQALRDEMRIEKVCCTIVWLG
jgi:hypothetical protein